MAASVAPMPAVAECPDDKNEHTVESGNENENGIEAWGNFTTPRPAFLLSAFLLSPPLPSLLPALAPSFLLLFFSASPVSPSFV
jgi:hypothetical protein